jgi:hemerythrin
MSKNIIWPKECTFRMMFLPFADEFLSCVLRAIQSARSPTTGKNDMKLEWKDSYKLGDAEIDAQHQQLFAMANAFLEAKGKAALTLCAMQLYKHTREHFELEEAAMRRLQVPALDAHIEWHNAIITRLNAISQSIQRDTLREQDLIDVMTEWAQTHILVQDAELAKFLSKG